MEGLVDCWKAGFGCWYLVFWLFGFGLLVSHARPQGVGGLCIYACIYFVHMGVECGVKNADFTEWFIFLYLFTYVNGFEFISITEERKKGGLIVLLFFRTIRKALSVAAG